MNRPIIGKEFIRNRKRKTFIVVSDYYNKEDIEKIIPNIEIYYIHEIIDIDISLKMGKVVIYGLGVRGREIYKAVEREWY